MIPGFDFRKLVDAEKKLAAGQEISAEENALMKKHHWPRPKKLCSCGCGQPLEPRVDGERPRIDGREVNPDCYFEAFGKEIEEYPILPPRIRRRG